MNQTHQNQNQRILPDGEDNPVTSSYSLKTAQVQAYNSAVHLLCDIPSNQRYERCLLAQPWRPFLTLNYFNLAR